MDDNDNNRGGGVVVVPMGGLGHDLYRPECPPYICFRVHEWWWSVEEVERRHGQASWTIAPSFEPSGERCSLTICPVWPQRGPS